VKYDHVTQDYQDDVVARAIVEREKEHHHYELNRLNYESLLAELEADPSVPKEWPENIRHCRGLDREKLAAALKDMPEDYLVAAKLQMRDKITHDLITNRTAAMMVEMVYRGLCKQLPQGPRRAAAVTRISQQK